MTVYEFMTKTNIDNLDIYIYDDEVLKLKNYEDDIPYKEKYLLAATDDVIGIPVEYQNYEIIYIPGTFDEGRRIALIVSKNEVA